MKIRSKGKATKYNSERPHLGETDDIFLKTQIQELCPTKQQKVWVGYLQKRESRNLLSDLELNPVNICDDFQSHVLSAFSFDTGAL